MFERLKSLPLTIFLTILIWMYAEAQFTATQNGINLNLKLASPNNDVAVAFPDHNDRPTSSLNLTVSLRGTQSKVERIYQMSIGMITPPDEDFAQLTYVPTPEDLRIAEADGELNTIAMLNSLKYFRNNGIEVTSASPARVKIILNRALPFDLPELPVWVSGPPEVLARYDVDVQPKTVKLTVSGGANAISLLRDRVTSQKDPGIRAYLDISTEDRPSPALAKRKLRYVLPDGLTVPAEPAEVSFRIQERKPSAIPN